LTGELPILSKKIEEKCKREKIYYIYPPTNSRAKSQICTPVPARQVIGTQAKLAIHKTGSCLAFQFSSIKTMCHGCVRGSIIMSKWLNATVLCIH
jgi:hypothetical protein